jgi:hypothetical protein
MKPKKPVFRGSLAGLSCTVYNAAIMSERISMRSMVPALSIARPVGDLLAARPFAARVPAVFERACLLVTPGRDVLSLVLPAIGDGPLNIVVAAEAGAFDGLAAGMPARLEGDGLIVGGVQVTLAGAASWEPRPDWQRLRAEGAAEPHRLAELSQTALARAPGDSLPALLAPAAGQTAATRPRAEVEALRAGAAELAAARAGGRAGLAAAAARLAGLGGGLTPAGDDFLAGAMLRAWLDDPAPGAFCQAVLAAAEPRTTLLSAALLGAAARGECSAAWHRLLAGLAAGKPLLPAVDAVLAQGHTSGADALAGFLAAG